VFVTKTEKKGENDKIQEKKIKFKQIFGRKTTYYFPLVLFSFEKNVTSSFLG
jgi:hypothetical protein